MTRFSKTQIDKLGERLREGELTDDDLRMLFEYRHSFESAYTQVVEVIRGELGLDPIGRPAKSTLSIIEKLRRPKTRGYRFSQIQDIAGCRLVVKNLSEQDVTLEQLLKSFPEAKVDDLRLAPSHGYRAVHVIVKVNELHVEIQVRTKVQNVWAQMCEQLSDRLDPMIKYGGGPPLIKASLSGLSDALYEMQLLLQSASQSSTWDTSVDSNVTRIDSEIDHYLDAITNFMETKG